MAKSLDPTKAVIAVISLAALAGSLPFSGGKPGKLEQEAQTASIPKTEIVQQDTVEYTIGNGPESRNPDAGEFYHNLHAYNFDAFRDAIISVESNGNPNAHNKTSGARGLMQITPKGGLAEWNKCNPHKRYSEKDLFDEEINRKIGSWYIQKIVQYLEWYNIEPTIENVASVYNCGIGNFMKSLKNNTNLPAETQEYFRKVRARTDSGIKPQVKERNWERR